MFAVPPLRGHPRLLPGTRVKVNEIKSAILRPRARLLSHPRPRRAQHRPRTPGALPVTSCPSWYRAPPPGPRRYRAPLPVPSSRRQLSPARPPEEVGAECLRSRTALPDSRPGPRPHSAPLRARRTGACAGRAPPHVRDTRVGGERGQTQPCGTRTTPELTRNCPGSSAAPGPPVPLPFLGFSPGFPAPAFARSRRPHSPRLHPRALRMRGEERAAVSDA